MLLRFSSAALALVAAGLVACGASHAAPKGTDAGVTEDAGQHDAGCGTDEIEGASGNCRNACIACEDSAGCDAGTVCLIAAGGCASCQPGGATTCSGRACLSNADCCGGTSCIGPNDPPQCGVIPPPVPQECKSTVPCNPGQVCQPVQQPPCSSSPTPGSSCTAPCSSSSCTDAGYACGDAGTCDPVSCSDGYVCPMGDACAPGEGDIHDCTTVACSSDSDCTQGVCVNGLCSPTPGFCTLPVP